MIQGMDEECRDVLHFQREVCSVWMTDPSSHFSLSLRNNDSTIYFIEDTLLKQTENTRETSSSSMNHTQEEGANCVDWLLCHVLFWRLVVMKRRETNITLMVPFKVIFRLFFLEWHFDSSRGILLFALLFCQEEALLFLFWRWFGRRIFLFKKYWGRWCFRSRRSVLHTSFRRWHHFAWSVPLVVISG